MGLFDFIGNLFGGGSGRTKSNAQLADKLKHILIARGNIENIDRLRGEICRRHIGKIPPNKTECRRQVAHDKERLAQLLAKFLRQRSALNVIEETRQNRTELRNARKYAQTVLESFQATAELLERKRKIQDITPNINNS